MKILSGLQAFLSFTFSSALRTSSAVKLTRSTTHELEKKGERKVQGVPQSQTAALPRPVEEEETDKSKQVQIEQTYEKHQD